MVALLAYKGAVKRVRPQLTARVIRVRLGRIRLEGSRFQIAVIISNPTSQNIVVRSVVGEVYLNGKKVGTVENFTKTDILPNAKTTLYLALRLLALQSFDAILHLVNNAARPDFEFGMTGTINVDNRPIPFQITYDVL